MHGLHLRRAERVKDLIGVEDCVQIEVNSLPKNLEKDNMLAKVGRSELLKYNKCSKSKEDIEIEHQAKYLGKTQHGLFNKAIDEVMDRKSWGWLKSGT